ncbi:MAG TPA: hypothetical protein VFN21_07475 [Acidimicrobiales bacterium]|nr:hypothetical protein [Acidimicrobiales bacterium]
MGFRISRGVHSEQIDAGFLLLRQGSDEVLQIQGAEAEAFALAQVGTRDVPARLTTPMAGLVELGVVETDEWSRRRVLQLGGAVAAAGVAVIALPTVAAAGSPPDTTAPDTTAPVTTTPDPNPCILFDWGGQTSNAPLSAGGTGKTSNVRVGKDSLGNPVSTTLTVTDAVVGTPAITGIYSATGSAYRNFEVNTRPTSGAGSISGYGNNDTQAGLILIQDNGSGTPNPNPSAVGNYQEVTFTFSAPVTSLTFTVYDISAMAVAGAATGYMDGVGFSAAPTVVGDSGAGRSVGGQLVGSGTFSDPFRRVLATDNYWGADPNDPDHNVPLDVTVSFAGPLTELKLRYSSLAGPATQFIKIGDLQSGGGCTAIPTGS